MTPIHITLVRLRRSTGSLHLESLDPCDHVTRGPCARSLARSFDRSFPNQINSLTDDFAIEPLQDMDASVGGTGTL